MAVKESYSARLRDWRSSHKDEEIGTFYFDWEVIEQNPAKNRSTIKWACYVEFDDESGNAEFYIKKLKVNCYGSKFLIQGNYATEALNLMNDVDALYRQNNRKIVTIDNGTYVVQHSRDGSTTHTIEFSSSAFYRNGDAAYNTVNDYYSLWSNYKKFESQLDNINRALHLLVAPDFTDEESPVVTYEADATGEATMQQIALSFDGVNDDIAYRSIEANQNKYTFTFTDEEKQKIIEKTVNSVHTPIYYLTKTVIRDTSNNQNYTFTRAVQRTITVVGAQPSLNPTVKDIQSDTLALTGNENIFILNESMVEFDTGAVASKGATIVSQSVTCGSKTVTDMYKGVIDDIESGVFTFNVTDSRGLSTTSVLENFAVINYLKPTCYQEAAITLTGETGAVINLKVTGSYYNGSFGSVNNTFLLQVRYKASYGDFGEWITITEAPEFADNTYTVEKEFSGLNYNESYTFQCRLTDKLNFVESAQYVVKLLPVFDWSETDFNFNVPVNIGADELTMHNNTIIRHSNTTNNTVLSANNGNIYLRPGGTNSTSGETIFYGNGDIKFGGSVDFDTFTIDGNTLNDFVIETGEEAMGSNGTWYWRKWASGKSEAWGCRNFGNMAVTTAWGNLYRSAALTQDLPNKVFIRTPDSININIVHGNFGGWICKHEQTAPSATTTGSFIWVRPASATVSPTNIGFYIVGEWL